MRLFYTVSESVFSETQIYNGGSLCVGTGAMHPFGKGPSRKSASWAEVSAPSAGPLLLPPPGHQGIGSGHSTLSMPRLSLPLPRQRVQSAG